MADGLSEGSHRPFLARIGSLVCGVATAVALMAAVPAVASAALTIGSATLQNRTACPADSTADACGPPGSVLIGGINSGGITNSTVTVSRTGTTTLGAIGYSYTGVAPTPNPTVGASGCVGATNFGVGSLGPVSRNVNPVLPRAPGTYTISLRAYSNAPVGGAGGCTQNASQPFTRTVVVTTPHPNPHFALPCGLKVALVLDESASLSVQEGNQTRDAAIGFVRALRDTGARVAVIAFAQQARTLVGYTDVTDSTISSTFEPRITQTANNGFLNPPGTGARNGTNWQGAFGQVVGLGAPNLVMFITDGDPNGTAATTSFSTTLDGGVDVMRPAAADADSLKRAGSHVFAIGVGAAVNNQGSQSRLTAVSGSREFTEAAGIAHSDWATLSFAQLADSLTHFVGELCEGTLTITKQEWLPNAAGWTPGAGWTFTATLKPPPDHEWLHPSSAGSGNSASLTTGADGVARFEWRLPVPETATLSVVRERSKRNFTLVASECASHEADGTVHEPQQWTTQPIARELRVPPRGWATCTVRNRQKVADIEVVKNLVPFDDPGKFDLLVDGVAHKTAATNGSTTGQVEVGLGTATVGEVGTAGTDTNLADYSVRITCRNHGVVIARAAGASVSVPVRSQTDDIVCTITNTSRTHGLLTIVKHLVPGTDPGTFDLLLNGNATSATGVGDGGSTGPMRLAFGTYTVGEVAAAGSAVPITSYAISTTCYQRGRPVASGIGGPGHPVPVRLSRTANNILCIITNRRSAAGVPFLTVRLTVVPSDDPGRFDLRVDDTTFASAVGDGGATGRLQFEPDTTHHISLRVSALQRSVVSLSDYSIHSRCRGVRHSETSSGTGPTPLRTHLFGANDKVDCEILLTRTHPPGPEPEGGGEVPPDPCHEFDSAGRPECGDVAAAPHLVVTKQTPAHARVGDRVPVTITVENVGHATAHEVRVHETPEGGRIVHVADGGSLQPDGTAVWHLGSLAPGERRTVHATMLLTRSGLLTDTAVAAPENADPEFDVETVRARPAARRPPPPPPPPFTG